MNIGDGNLIFRFMFGCSDIRYFRNGFPFFFFLYRDRPLEKNSPNFNHQLYLNRNNLHTTYVIVVPEF